MNFIALAVSKYPIDTNFRIQFSDEHSITGPIEVIDVDTFMITTGTLHHFFASSLVRTVTPL